MRTSELAVVYFLIGSGAALALLVRARGRGLLDAVLLVPFWPLYGPFLLASHAQAEAPPQGRLLPGGLAERLDAAHRRITEIDRLLERPEFSEQATEARRRALEKGGDLRAARAAEARLINIRRLAALRERCRREVTEVDELLGQLSVQAEVVRLAGNDASMEDLVQEIVHRVEGLDAILDLHQT